MGFRRHGGGRVAEVFVAPVAHGVRAETRALAVEDGARACRVAEEALDGLGQVVALQHVVHLVLDPGLQVGDDDGNAVDDRVLALAGLVRTEEDAFEDIVALRTCDMGSSSGWALRPAGGTLDRWAAGARSDRAARAVSR